MPDSVITTSTRGRPRRSSGTNCAPVKPAIAVVAWLGAHQPQRLGDRTAFGLEIVGAPQHHRDGLGQRLRVGGMPRQQPLGLARAVLHRKGARNAERIEAVEIAAGRQDVLVAQQVAARRRSQIAAVEGMQDRRRLVIGCQQRVEPARRLRAP